MDYSFINSFPYKKKQCNNYEFSILNANKFKAKKPKKKYSKFGVRQGIECCNESSVANLFFSQDNMLRIQNKLKQEVLNRTNGKFIIDDQDNDDLYIVMNSIYLQYGLNKKTKIVHQVKDLNKKTILAILPDLISNIAQYYGYLNDINKPLQVGERPMNVSTQKNVLPALTSVIFTKPY